MRHIQPPFPRGYDPNATCEFHLGASRHSTENCNALKYVVHDLIDSKWLTFKKDGMNAGTSASPRHGKPSVNAIEGDQNAEDNVINLVRPRLANELKNWKIVCFL